MKRYDAIVIGAGLNGLTTAAYLAKAGRSVLVLERRPIVGGAAVTEEFADAPGFRFDAVTDDVAGLDPKIVRDLDLALFGLRFVDGSPSVFTPLPDGGGLVLSSDIAESVESISRFSRADADKWSDFIQQITLMARFLAEVNSTTPPRVTEISPQNLSTVALLGLELRSLGGKQVFEFLRTMPMPVADSLDEWFESDVLKGTLGAAGIHGIMLGPRSSGTMHNLLRQSRDGIRAKRLLAWGIGNLAQSLGNASRAYGAEIRTNAEVAQIIVRHGQALGVLLASGEEVYARQVVSSADPRRTCLGFIDPLHLDHSFINKVRHIRFRGASARAHFALGEPPILKDAGGQSPHAVISVSPNLDYLERAFDDAKYGMISKQPYLEVTIPSLMDPSRAPEGKHSMSVTLQYAPYYLRDRSWENKREAIGDLIVDTLEPYIPNIRSAIEYRKILTPCDLEETYGLTEGNINHGDVTLDQFFFMRPVPGWAQYRTPIERLFLCGAGTHPGGIPCQAGRNAAREILKLEADG